MANDYKQLTWDQVGERYFETGVSKGVIYPYDNNAKKYGEGYAWNGLTGVTESPSGAESTDLFADNIKYLSLQSAETFKATVQAYTYPKQFAECDGSAQVIPGVYVGQQNRKSFGFSYTTNVGNDTSGNDYGYKIHIVYGCKATPSEKAYNTVNDNPDAITFSWEFDSTPVPEFTVDGVKYKPTSVLTIDVSQLDDETRSNVGKLEEYLYGKTGERAATLLMPLDVYTILKNGALSA